MKRLTQEQEIEYKNALTNYKNNSAHEQGGRLDLFKAEADLADARANYEVWKRMLEEATKRLDAIRAIVNEEG